MASGWPLGPALLALAALVAGAFVFWRVRRGRRGGAEAWAEAACPVCVGLGIISDRVPALVPLTVPEAYPPGESDQDRTSAPSPAKPAKAPPP